MRPALMLFAAGFGTRMGALTRDKPKPLVSVAGKPLLDHALALADPLDWRAKVVNTHYRGDQIVSHLAQRDDIQISDESAEILETGGGLRHALPLLGAGPVMTLNTDAVWRGSNPLSVLRDAWNPEAMDALLLLVPLKNALGHKGTGDFTGAPGALNRGAGAIYSGAQILNPAGLKDIPDAAFSLNVLWNRMQANRRLHGILYDGDWCDVGQPESLPLAESLLS